MPFESELVDRAVSVLSVGCRDTDYIGWYRQGRILGVLLTALRSDSAGESCGRLKTVEDRVRGVLTFPDDHSFQVHVLEQSELTAMDPADHPASSPGSKD